MEGSYWLVTFFFGIEKRKRRGERERVSSAVGAVGAQLAEVEKKTWNSVLPSPPPFFFSPSYRTKRK